MRVAITGSSGLIGTALTASLQADGHQVVRLVRRPPRSADEIRWDPRAADAGNPVLTGVDACVHLAGAGVGDHRWTAAYKAEIRSSRVLATRALAAALVAATQALLDVVDRLKGRLADVAILLGAGRRVTALKIADASELLGIVAHQFA